jgi:hypothetical protein
VPVLLLDADSCGYPSDLDLYAGRLYVVCFDDIMSVELSTLVVAESVSMFDCSAPQYISIDPTMGVLFASCYDAVIMLNISNGEVRTLVDRANCKDANTVFPTTNSSTCTQQDVYGEREREKEIYINISPSIGAHYMQFSTPSLNCVFSCFLLLSLFAVVICPVL